MKRMTSVCSFSKETRYGQGSVDLKNANNNDPEQHDSAMDGKPGRQRQFFKCPIDSLQHAIPTELESKKTDFCPIDKHL